MYTLVSSECTSLADLYFNDVFTRQEWMVDNGQTTDRDRSHCLTISTVHAVELTSVVRSQQSMPIRSLTLTVMAVMKGSSPDVCVKCNYFHPGTEKYD